jgi:hypothetical protein
MTSPYVNHLISRIDQRGRSDSFGPLLELGRARFRDLRSAGHKIERFLAARGAVLRHATKKGNDQVASWLRTADAPPSELRGDGLFCCAALVGESDFTLLQPVLAQDLTAQLVDRWLRLDPAVPKTLPDAFEIPADANAPLWLALLRLRPWHELWQRELRRGTFEDLLDLLPDAWLLDPTPFPPGAVVPRLELSTWNDLPRLMASSARRFLLASPRDEDGGTLLDGTMPQERSRALIREALRDFAKEPRVLTELPAEPNASHPWLISFYQRKAGRVEGVGAFALAPDGEGALVPARVVSV